MTGNIRIVSVHIFRLLGKIIEIAEESLNKK